VPVGKDQQQHLEMTRDIAGSFNHSYGDVLVVPEGKYDERVMIVPGTDGRKMSKSYDNFLNIFLPEKQLKKQVMGIVTDATPLEDPKDPDTCNVFALYSLLAEAPDTQEMRNKYLAGGFGYGHAKSALLELILDSFKEERVKFDSWMNDKTTMDQELKIGADKARIVASETLSRVRKAAGY